ncbi:MAG TPA: glycosyltransferase, partial [Acidimicrobiales bacterium]|nr:glycosyltransferase [Acidimicrobiales bacterium]
MTTVGVTMSVYNGAATVGQALASVAAQTRRPDQLVVVDDGSTDGTPAIVEAWSAVLPLTLVRHETNRGLAQGRMSGIERLDTDLVLALDADDAWLPDHLALLLAAYRRRPGIVSPMAVAWNPSSPNPVNWSRRLQPLPKSLDLRHLLLMNFLFSGSLFERTAYEAAGGEYRFVDSNSPEDWDLWLRLTATGVQVSVLEEPTVLYRVHGSNMSADDRLLPMEIRVLEAFIAEHDDAALLAVARTSLQHRRARTALRAAY